MERNIQRNGLINLLALLVAGIGGFAAARYSNSLAGLVGVLFIGLGVLVAAVSWFQMRLEEGERLEKFAALVSTKVVWETLLVASAVQSAKLLEVWIT